MGKLFYDLHISHAATLIQSIDSIVQKRISLLDSILPREYTYLHMEENTTNNGIAKVYRLIFEHPFFEDGSKIELDLVRIRWKADKENECLVEDSVLIGVKYTDPDGKPKLS